MLTTLAIGAVLLLAAASFIVAWALRESWLGDVIREVAQQILECGLRLIFETFAQL